MEDGNGGDAFHFKHTTPYRQRKMPHPRGITPCRQVILPALTVGVNNLWPPRVKLKRVLATNRAIYILSLAVDLALTP